MPNSPTPIEVANRLVFAHPAFFLGTGAQIDLVDALISNLPSIPGLATAISRQTNSGWASRKTVTSGALTATCLIPSTKTLDAAASCLAEAAARVAATPGFEGVLWFPQSAGAAGYRPVTPPSGFDWAVEGVGVGYGIAIGTLACNEMMECRAVVTNASARYIGLYARFVDADGKPTTAPDWRSRLPARVDPRFETESCKFLALVPPMVPVAGVPSALADLQVDFSIPLNAAAVILEFGTVGFGAWDAVTCGLGAMATALLCFAAPNVITRAGADLNQVYQDFVTTKGVVDDALSAAACLLGTDTIQDALGILAEQTPALVYEGRLDDYGAALATAAGSRKAMFAAAAEVAWAAALLRVSAAGYLPVPVSAPCRFAVTVSPSMIGDAVVMIMPDPADGALPAAATTIEVTATQAGRVRKAKQSIPGCLYPSPMISLSGFSADAPVAAVVSVTDAGGRELASGRGAGTGNWLVPATVTVTLSERRPPLGEVACLGGLGFQTAIIGWQPANAPTATIADLNSGSQGHNLAQVNSLALSADGRTIAYAWEASGQDIPFRGSDQPTDGQIFAFQSVGMPPGPAGFSRPFWGLGRSIAVAFDPVDPTSAYYVEQDADGLARFRPYVPGQTIPDALVSCGAVPLESVHDVAVLPSGLAVAISADKGLLATVALGAAVPDGKDVVGTVTGGLGRPVAVAAAPDGTVLVLDAHGARVLAVNAYGVPVPAFPKAATVLSLDFLGSGRTWLDLAIDVDGNLHLVSFAGDGRTVDQYRLDSLSPEGISLSATPSFAAARIVVTPWRVVVGLNYACFEGLLNSTQPLVTLWCPLLAT